MNIRIKYCTVCLATLSLAAFISFRLYAASQSDCPNTKASASSSTTACEGCSATPKADDTVCEYDSTPDYAGCSQDCNNGTSVRLYKGEESGGFYVNCMDRHYWGYCSSGQCVGVVSTNSGFFTEHVVYITVKCQ
jgi:hypothetical protein